ncbi:hypothetical protein [Formosa maritima]|uniref:Uncharacterized protein n=1 Tax=Formosa maritima TaxID=2592046 RepID=A0A5D0G3B3_9FLAO|nr:hypothetical protein [Formosa maritima]TYA52357.1 hypothetical protein FVF61_13525 [Formosa maritima]
MKLILNVLLIVCLFSCKENTDNSLQTEDNATISISKKTLQKLNYTDYVLDTKVKKITRNWEKYTELERVIVNLKQGDLSYFKGNQEILEALIIELRQNIPEKLNSPAIMSRLITLETKMYKLESVVNLSNSTTETLINSVKEVLVSFSNLNFQMNKKIERDSQKIKKP